MKRNGKKEDKMAVDDQKYGAVIMYMLQIVDMLSDLAFALQCRTYWLYGVQSELVEEEHDTEFMWLYHLALVCLIGPYAMNIYSSIDITRSIERSETISKYSKRYFQDRSKVFTILVLMSGGAFPALKLMSSNLMGLQMFSAGLSTIQLEQFRSHHVLATVLAENIPQLCLQYYFMFKLNLATSIVIVSFISSIFNILRAILSA